MLEALGHVLFRFLGRAVPRLMRWFYTAAKIQEQIKVRLPGEGDGVRFDCGQAPSVSIHLQVLNLSPFSIELDRLLCQVTCDAVVGDLIFLEKQSIPPAGEVDIYFGTTLFPCHADHVRKGRGHNAQTKLFVNAYFDCKVHRLQVKRHIDVANVRFINMGA